MSRITFILVCAIALAVPAAAQTHTDSPAYQWASCAGALVVKQDRLEDKVLAAVVGPMARHALAQAKKAENPTRLTDQQLDGVALSAASNFNRELTQDPSRIPAFETAVEACMDALAKLPE